MIRKGRKLLMQTLQVEKIKGNLTSDQVRTYTKRKDSNLPRPWQFRCYVLVEGSRVKKSYDLKCNKQTNKQKVGVQNMSP